MVHGFFLNGVLRGAAELRPLGLRLPQQAEAAFSVEKPWQSHGIGSALLRRTLLTARNRGFRMLHMACLADNRRMPAAGAQIRRRAIVRFRRRRRRSRVVAANAAVDDARSDGRQPRLRDGDARSAIAHAESVAAAIFRRTCRWKRRYDVGLGARGAVATGAAYGSVGDPCRLA